VKIKQEKKIFFFQIIKRRAIWWISHGQSRYLSISCIKARNNTGVMKRKIHPRKMNTSSRISRCYRVIWRMRNHLKFLHHRNNDSFQRTPRRQVFISQRLLQILLSRLKICNGHNKGFCYGHVQTVRRSIYHIFRNVRNSRRGLFFDATKISHQVGVSASTLIKIITREKLIIRFRTILVIWQILYYPIEIQKDYSTVEIAWEKSHRASSVYHRRINFAWTLGNPSETTWTQAVYWIYTESIDA
jgi:hypothetical protein